VAARSAPHEAAKKRTGPLDMAAANHQEHGPHSGPMFLIMMPPPVQRPCFFEAVLHKKL